jgi:hypothetical protein
LVSAGSSQCFDKLSNFLEITCSATCDVGGVEQSSSIAFFGDV